MVGGARIGSKGEVGEHYWVNNERIVMEVWQRQPWKDEPEFYGELAGVNFDGSRFFMLYGYRAGQQSLGSNIGKREGVMGWAQLINTLPDDENHVLISSTKMSRSGGRHPRIHKMNVYSGKLSRPIVSSPVPYASFVTDQQGSVKFVSGIDSDFERRVYTRDEDEWNEITGQYGDSFRPLALDNSGQKLFFLDALSGDKKGLHSLDLTTGKRSEVYTDERVDITGISFNAARDAVYALRVDDGYPAYVMFNEVGDEAKSFKSLLATFPWYTVDITSTSRDKNRMIIYVSNDIDAGTYYLYTRDANSLLQLFTNYEDLDIDQMAQTTPFNFKSFDGTDIQGYVTYPNQLPENGKVPLVTLVHGGPRARDYWLFDPEVQMLAAQGYAVARINYRGSEGYGEDFVHAGDLHWGDSIQKDMVAGTEYLVAQGKVDAEKMCIMGASFGGYSALMAPINAPDLFQCAVAHVGVFDLSLMKDNGDVPELLWGSEYLDETIGSNEQQLAQFSPVNHVDKLTIPVFIAHGKRDKRVPFEHAERLRDALDKQNKDYEWFVKDSESHGFFNEENRAEYFVKVSEFLAEHLD